MPAIHEASLVMLTHTSGLAFSLVSFAMQCELTFAKDGVSNSSLPWKQRQVEQHSTAWLVGNRKVEVSVMVSLPKYVKEQEEKRQNHRNN